MLSKEERNAIAERIGKEFDYIENDEVYEALIGEEIPDNTTLETDCKVVRNRLIELCDTSNMIELPLDKDGECTKVLPHELTHKQPATIQDLSERMQGVLKDYLFSVDSNLHTELVSIADQLKELASKDE